MWIREGWAQVYGLEGGLALVYWLGGPVQAVVLPFPPQEQTKRLM